MSRAARAGRYVAFQMAEVAISRHLFADILRLIAELRPPPDPVPAPRTELTRDFIVLGSLRGRQDTA
jgi:hypothetical protein